MSSFCKPSASGAHVFYHPRQLRPVTPAQGLRHRHQAQPLRIEVFVLYDEHDQVAALAGLGPLHATVEDPAQR